MPPGKSLLCGHAFFFSSSTFVELCIVLVCFFVLFVIFLSRSRCSLVHIPDGPRKSGMPALVEIPAPVNTTVYSDCWINRNNLSTLYSKARCVSWVSGRPHIPLEWSKQRSKSTIQKSPKEAEYQSATTTTRQKLRSHLVGIFRQSLCIPWRHFCIYRSSHWRLFICLLIRDVYPGRYALKLNKLATDCIANMLRPRPRLPAEMFALFVLSLFQFSTFMFQRRNS